MGRPKVSQEEFIELFETLGPQKAADQIGISVLLHPEVVRVVDEETVEFRGERIRV